MTDYERLYRQAEQHRKQYPPGTRLYLIHMNDPYAPVPEGTRGTVDHIDDGDNIHMRWDNNRTLALVPDEDAFRKLTDEELTEELLVDSCEEDQPEQVQTTEQTML